MEPIHIQFTLFSAFYSPLIADHGRRLFEGRGPWTPPGRSPRRVCRRLWRSRPAEADVIQTAPSQAFNSLAKGETPTAVHFAQINEMDGFFITGREPDPDFSWVEAGGCRGRLVRRRAAESDVSTMPATRPGIDAGKIEAIVVGGAADMDKAFRDGQGAYIQQQGPFPQQLAADGVGHVLAQVGPLISACAFSSVAATRDWLETDKARGVHARL